MKTAIFYDTETTGFPVWGEPSNSKLQPHIVQLALAMVNLETRSIVQSLDFIIKPDGWDIPKEVSDIHGITHEMAMDVGIEESQVIKMFHRFMIENNQQSCRFRVAHNESFDQRIIRIATKRYLDSGLADFFKAGDAYCTMKSATHIVNLPPTDKMLAAGFNRPKNPNLSEAYEFFTGKELDGAHNAMVDVKACIDVYFGIQDYNENLKEAS